MFLKMKSNNSKIGKMAATYVPINKTCPTSCPLKDNGCYAKQSFVGMHNFKLQQLNENKKAYDIIRSEAREIIKMGPKAKGQTLRIHVSGDARTNASAKLLSNAATYWDGKVYSYTHAWREVNRESWGGISILASCENMEDVKAAYKKGYASAIVVDTHKDEKAYMAGEFKIIPCPNQTKDVKCIDCGLCMNDKFLKDNKSVIAFAVHGAGKKKALKVLK